MNWYIILIRKRERKSIIDMCCVIIYLKSLNYRIIFSIEDDDEIERDLSRAGLAQRNKNCVVQ